MADALILEASREGYCQPEDLAGMVSTPFLHAATWDGERGVQEMASWSWPELFEARCFERLPRGGVVVPINGRTYRVFVEYDRCDRMPTNVSVSFIETDAPDSEGYTLWDVEAERARFIAQMEARLVSSREELASADSDDWRDYATRSIQRDEDRLFNMRNDPSPAHPNAAVVFGGQPNFIQHEGFYAHEGDTARCLCTLNTGWGDCGSIVIMLACDSEGRPARIWTHIDCY